MEAGHEGNSALEMAGCALRLSGGGEMARSVSWAARFVPESDGDGRLVGVIWLSIGVLQLTEVSWGVERLKALCVSV